MMFMVETPLSQNNMQLFAQLEDNNTSPSFIGVAMRGNSTSAKEHDENDIPFPKNYYEDSFKLIHDAGMNHVRYLFYWESYAKNPSLFLEELVTVAQSADRWGIKVHSMTTINGIRHRGWSLKELDFPRFCSLVTPNTKGILVAIQMMQLPNYGGQIGGTGRSKT